jgi:hypothetical protein
MCVITSHWLLNLTMALSRMWKASIPNKFVRQYSNRNILKLHERGMFEDIFPETSK